MSDFAKANLGEPVRAVEAGTCFLEIGFHYFNRRVDHGLYAAIG